MKQLARISILLTILLGISTPFFCNTFAAETPTGSWYFASKVDKLMRKYDDEKKSGSTTGSIRGRDDTGTWIFWKFFMTNTPWSNTWDTEKTNESKKEWMDTGNPIPHIDIDTTVEEFYSKLVLETYKTQLKKNIKDLDITLKKIYPDETDRWEAYKKIKETYENVQENIKENTSSGSIGGLNKKQMKIYDESLTYLIWLLDIRINSLGK